MQDTAREALLAGLTESLRARGYLVSPATPVAGRQLVVADTVCLYVDPDADDQGTVDRVDWSELDPETVAVLVVRG